VFLMLDTCHAGALKVSAAKIGSDQSDRIAGQIENSTGMMTLAGSTGYQGALDNFKHSGHGLLAYTALRALQGDMLIKQGNETVPAETFALWVRNHAGEDAYNEGLNQSVDLHKSSETRFQGFPLVQLQSKDMKQ